MSVAIFTTFAIYLAFLTASPPQSRVDGIFAGLAVLFVILAVRS